MRMINCKKEIFSYFKPDNLEWVTGEIGAPPFDVSGVAYCYLLPPFNRKVRPYS